MIESLNAKPQAPVLCCLRNAVACDWPLNE
jgi:hypothetical protein